MSLWTQEFFSFLPYSNNFSAAAYSPFVLVLQRYQWVILNAECVSPSESEQQSQGLLNRIVFCVGFDRPFIHRAIRCARG